MAQIEPASPAATPAGASQYLTFALGEEHYGIEILMVQEIKGYAGITPIPNTPSFLKGVMNLRGCVVPVVDLRDKFRMQAQDYSKFTVIIVVTVREKVIGLVVDAVSDVVSIASSEVRPAPDLGAQADVRFIAGIASAGGKLIVLLDMEQLLSEQEMHAVAANG